LDKELLSEKVDSLLFWGFCIAIFLFRIPSVYLFPLVKADLLTTQVLARIVIFIISLYLVLIKKVTPKKTLTLILVLLYFVSQSLSVLAAINVSSFLSQYKDVVIGMLAFYCFNHFQNKHRAIYPWLIIPVFINLFYQYLLIFVPSSIKILEQLVYQKYWGLVIQKLDRGQVYLETFDEAFVPFLIFQSYNTQTWQKTAGILTTVLITFFSFISNIRTRILLILVSILGTVLVRLNRGLIIFSLLSLIGVAVTVNMLSLRLQQFSFFDRITLQNEAEDVSTLTSRRDQVYQSFEMGQKSITGVGLGNYYDNLFLAFKRPPKSMSWQNVAETKAVMFVHNVIGSVYAETGIIGLACYLIMLAAFLRDDFEVWKQGKSYKVSLIVCFWTLFTFGMLNPPISGSYQFLFWGIRGWLLAPNSAAK